MPLTGQLIYCKKFTYKKHNSYTDHMNRKHAFVTGTVIGSFIGSLIPLLWGASMFSFASVIFTALGGTAGLYLAFKLVQ